jgi:hypothetical protein
MQRQLMILVLTAGLVMGLAPAALATYGGSPDTGCQVGAAGANDTAAAEGWQEMTVEEFAQFLVDDFNAPDYETALGRATLTYAFCDHNDDGQACITKQTFPNAATGSAVWWLAEDNHPIGG